MEKNRKQIIICAAIVACVCVISVLITYNILQQILYLIFDYPHKHYTFKYFEV